ncbi:hypothetical protein SAMN04489762_2269 [Terribacillus saccharophilus]|jgi:hypothetical protein|uniref:Uncharacterized protein n=1 Tax=Terribacillus saccharophilus TaxID=361277 RepID=A0AAX2EGN7_9BACI|nr:hypothetical protein SAMN04489762_2269 [Terribacillus saccharophilus]
MSSLTKDVFTTYAEENTFELEPYLDHLFELNEEESDNE